MESNEQAAGKLPWELAEIFSFKLERDRSHTAQETPITITHQMIVNIWGGAVA